MKSLQQLFIILIGLLLSSSAFAQPKNVVRLGLTGFAANHFNLAYERGLGERTSVGLQLGYVYGFGDQITSRVDIVDPDEFSINPFKGLVLHQEWRFYSAKYGAPKGFYLAPYFRYSNLNASAGYTYDSGPGALPSVLTTELKYSQVALGMQLGTQFMIKDMVAIDFFWMGPRLYGQNTYTINVSGNRTTNMQDVADDIDAEDILGDIPVVGGLVKVETNATADELEIKVKHPVFLLPWRFGLSVGYAF